MASTYTFLKSPLGARIKSPLGAFQCSVIGVLEIFTVPLFLIDGETYIVTGEVFGAIQGAGLLEIANNPDFDDVVVSQSVSTWADGSITFVYGAAGLPSDGILWIKVISDSGQSDSATTQTGGLICMQQTAAHAFLSGIGILCMPYYQACVNLFNPFNDFDYFGYQSASNFLINSPGFYLIGRDSGQVIEFGYRDHYQPSINSASWCSISGGVMGFSDLAAPYLYALQAPNPGLALPCPAIWGWINGETVSVIPKYPVSIQIISPSDSAPVPRNITLDGFSFASEGDISSSISWSSDIDGALGIGSPITILIAAGAHEIRASITNAHGQQRFAIISVTAISLSIASIAATSGTTAGGDSVTITGDGFSPAATVAFDGVPATSVVVVGLTSITCVTPAHAAGVVDVVVTDVSLTATLPSGYTYV